MEQGQCWMQAKRKFSLASNLTSPTSNPSYDDSWEEQAFAEDAAGSLGGCIWPPRSYSCSFCRREFRSAQALGGHMNVHRRDRARLKQPSSPKNNEILCHDHLETHHLDKPIQNAFASLGYNNRYPSPVCGLACNKVNPNSDFDVLIASPSSSSPSKALAPPSVTASCREETMIPLCNSSIIHKTSQVCCSESWSNLGGDNPRLCSKFHPEGHVEKASRGLDNDDDTDVAVSLNLVVCRAHSPLQFKTEEADISCKRRKTDASLIPFLPKSSSVDRHHMQPQVFELSPSSIEELDLELRLGNRSKV